MLGGGIAGLSACVYLGRAQRDTLLIDSGKSLVRWAPDIENYLGFPKGIAGEELLAKGRKQAIRHTVKAVQDDVLRAECKADQFRLYGKTRNFACRYLLIATGILHVPPDLNGVSDCLGNSIFFCKDCDGLRARQKRVAIYGVNDEAAEYALAMRIYSQHVNIVTDGRARNWSRKYAGCLAKRRIPIHDQKIVRAIHNEGRLQELRLEDGSTLKVGALFATRGDIFHNSLAKQMGAKISAGEIRVNLQMRTSVPRLYAAGCVTPANCQAIIAAGQGAAAAQAINREIFEAAL